MSTVATLTETQVKQFVLDWYHKLDVHAPLEDLLPMLTTEGLEFRLPETTLHNQADFAHWYDTVTHKFFNETHTMNELNVRIVAEQAEVQLVVNWQAYIWNAPAPNNQWIGFNAGQRWVVKMDPVNNRLMIVTYSVDSFTSMPGSPAL